MRPRLIAVDDAHERLALDRLREASMRPRLIAVDDHSLAAEQKPEETASMRPRLIAVDDPRGVCRLARRMTWLQ